MLGGDIMVSSVPEKGSTFSLVINSGPLDGIKLCEHPPDVAQPRFQNSTGEINLNCRILLAEDGPDNQRLISFLLRKAGAEVTIAENGQVAVDLALEAQRESCPFDVVLMDMQMPILDGYQATRSLRNAGYKKPILALTAQAMVDDYKKCTDAGCDAYLTKPIDRMELLKTLEAYFLKHSCC
jgi:CheY-like chemotaxis protein